MQQRVRRSDDEDDDEWEEEEEDGTMISRLQTDETTRKHGDNVTTRGDVTARQNWRIISYVGGTSPKAFGAVSFL